MVQKTTKPAYNLTVIGEDLAKFPELYCCVYIEGDAYEIKNFGHMLVLGRCTRTTNMDEADIVILTGGEDINPAIYGAAPHSTTFFDADRDRRDIEVFEYCVKNGIPMLGVCRGAQLIHAMMGGKLYQHVDNHNSPHDMFDLKTHRVLRKISSVHHQMCMEDSTIGMEVIATAAVSNNRWANEHINHGRNKGRDVEAFFYRDIAALGIQGHPEYQGYLEFTRWCLEKMQHYFCDNPDIGISTGTYRLKPEVIQKRVLNSQQLIIQD